MAEQPPTGEIPARPRTHRYKKNEAIDALPATVLSIFSHAASTGDVSRQKQFYKDSRILDSRLDAVSATRVLAIQGRPVTFRAPPGYEHDKQAIDIATRCTRLWNSTHGTKKAIGHLATATLEGDAGLAQRWVVDKLTGWWRPEFLTEQSHSTLFVWHPDTLEPWFCADGRVTFDKPSPTCFPLSAKPDQFLHFAPIAGRADDPWRRGALRSCVIRSLIKRLNIGHWCHLLERWGQPQVYAVVDADAIKAANVEDSASVEDDVNGALRALGRDWRAQVPKGVEFKEIAVSVASDLHSAYVTWADTADAISVLGQNLSTEASGGSFAAASAHNRIRIDILMSDCGELAEVLTDQWAEPVVRYNWPGAPVPYAEFIIAPKGEWTVAEWQAGLCSADQYLASKGYEAEPEGKGARYFVGQQPGATPGVKPGPTSPTDEPAKPSDTGEPGANTVDAPASDAPLAAPADAPADGDAMADTAAPETKAADTALTGIQGERLEAIVLNVKNGVYPSSVGKLLIQGTFPGLDPAFVDLLMSAVVDSGVSDKPVEPAAPPGAA